MLDPFPTKTYERVGRGEINAHARHDGEGVLLPGPQEEAANQGLHHVRQALVRQQPVLSEKKKRGSGDLKCRLYINYHKQCCGSESGSETTRSI
jgi:hypothetical protein